MQLGAVSCLHVHTYSNHTYVLQPYVLLGKLTIGAPTNNHPLKLPIPGPADPSLVASQYVEADMEEVRRIRELESAVLGDSSQLRNVQEMLRALRSTDPVVALAALHSLRRVFLHLLEADVFACLASAQSRKPHQWLSRHLEAFKAQLLEWVRLGSAQLVAPSVRSLVELVKRDHMRTGASPYFGYATYLALVRALLQCEALDVDVLLMVRAEVLPCTPPASSAPR